MLRAFLGILIVLHGLVHLWYVMLSQGWVEFQPEMGWTGESWFFALLLDETATRLLATASYGLAALGFVVGGIGFWTAQDWWRPVTVGSAALSAAAILLFWDGRGRRLVEKGLVGLLIDLALLFGLLVFGWPSVAR